MPATTKELEDFLEKHPDITHLDALVIDLCGNAIGKRLPRSAMASIIPSGSPLCAAMQLVDVLGNTADPMGFGFSDGDPDGYAVPIAGTLSTVPWLGKGHSQVLCELYDAMDRKPLWYEPRVVLRNVLGKFQDLGLHPVVAAELEFYFIDACRTESGEPQPIKSPRSGSRESQGKVLSLDKLDEFAPLLDGIESACREQGIPTTTMISEYGAGQFEVNLAHQSDPLVAADHAGLLRRAIQGVSRSMGHDATFMSKPFSEESGSGFHVHLSLVDGEGNNAFDPASDHGEKVLGHAIAGLRSTMAESMAIFAPNINVYRRFKPDEFVPVTRDWGENNRSVAIRLPISGNDNRRLEHRVSGAEANPYLVLAAVLSGVHYGIANELDPGEIATGNAGSSVDEELPLTPWAAFEAIANATVLPEYFGEKYPALYAEVKREEFNAFMDQATAREFHWYL